MTMKYKGIEFDNVEELVKYQELTEKKVVEDKPKEELELDEYHIPKKGEWRATKESKEKPIRRQLKNLRWIKKDIASLKRLYKEHWGGGKLKYRKIDLIVEELGRSKTSVWSMAHQLGIPAKLRKRATGPKPKEETTPKVDKRAQRMTFIGKRVLKLCAADTHLSYKKAFIQASDEFAGKGVGAKITPAKKKQVTIDELEFPDIYPLDGPSNKRFEQLLIDLMAGKHTKIDYMMGRSVLQLQADIEWHGRVWRTFCEHVVMNSTKINTALNVPKGGAFKVNIIGGYHVIKYDKKKRK